MYNKCITYRKELLILKRLNINISEELCNKIDAYALSMGINRTSAISVLLSTQIQQQETLGTLKGFIDFVEEEKMKQPEKESKEDL